MEKYGFDQTHGCNHRQTHTNTRVEQSLTLISSASVMGYTLTPMNACQVVNFFQKPLNAAWS